MNIDDIVSRARSEGRTLLNEIEAKELLHDAGVTVARTALATSAEQAQALAAETGFPVVMKIVSPDITHKSDVGGVLVGLHNAQEVAQGYAQIISNVKAAEPDADISGVAVQYMAPEGTEVIIGMTTDPQFGPVVMFGLGGILVEVLKDVVFRLVPVEERDAEQMLDEIKGKTILDGVRGQPALDKQALKDILLKVSGFVERNTVVRELDLNPVMVYPDGAIAVDARIVLAD